MVQLDRVAVAAVLVVQNTSKHLAGDALAALQYAVFRRRGFEASIVLPGGYMEAGSALSLVIWAPLA